ncbi:hypothetical protein KIPB_002882 [Kipferlia bialata]|uniref:Uncharacterized protein n=1 Tax=Kipferlia bialata TaxID=797122 RepID=A0A391NSQ7_9EUKA|nr:hypothetical protein KIPB_002882 [Kipferlia bialata]|eukprot:g2882.t1
MVLSTQPPMWDDMGPGLQAVTVVSILVTVIELCFFVAMLKHRKQSSWSGQAVCIMCFCMAVIVVGGSVWDTYIVLSYSDVDSLPGLLPYLACIYYCAGCTELLVCLALTLLYVQVFRSVLKPSTFRCIYRLVGCGSVCALVASLWVLLGDMLYNLEVMERENSDWYPEWHTHALSVSTRYLRVQIAAVVQLLVIMIALMVVRRGMARRMHQLSMPTQPSLPVSDSHTPREREKERAAPRRKSLRERERESAVPRRKSPQKSDILPVLYSVYTLGLVLAMCAYLDPSRWVEGDDASRGIIVLNIGVHCIQCIVVCVVFYPLGARKGRVGRGRIHCDSQV